MAVKIGIPRALSYYAYFPFWKAFFQEMGFEVVVSQPTTKGILDRGVKEAVTDACVPIKLFHGHVLDLKNRADYIFIPRLVSVNREKNVTFCPKFLGLPDMIKSSLPGLPPLIDIRVDLRKGYFELFNICRRVTKQFGKSFISTIKAYFKGRQAQKKYRKLLQKHLTPMEALDILEGKEELPQTNTQETLSFALLGFPYAINDRFISVDIVKRLRELGVKVLTSDMVSPAQLAKEAKKLPKNLFWNFSNQVMRAALYFLDRQKVDGIIHITAFGCGPDAMVDKLIELEAKERGKVPFMSITIDEHTGEAGILTRLEAFVDMLRLRRGVI